MINAGFKKLLVIMLAQSIVLCASDTQKSDSTEPSIVALLNQLLKVSIETNLLLDKLLNSTDKSNTLAGQSNKLAKEHIDALKEQNRIHHALVQQQQNALHSNWQHEPPSPSSHCANQRPPSSVNTPMSASATTHLASGAQLMGRIAMFGLMRSPRVASSVATSASSPNLQSLRTSAAAQEHVPSQPLSPVFSPANAQAAATPSAESTATAASGTQPPKLTLTIKIEDTDNKS